MDLNAPAFNFVPRLNPDAHVFEPATHDTNAFLGLGRDSRKQGICHFGVSCTNPMCTYWHEAELSWNPKVQAASNDQMRLCELQEKTGAQIIIDEDNKSFKVCGSQASVTAAVSNLQDCMLCKYGVKCHRADCAFYHICSLPVKGSANADFVSCPENLAAIRNQTGAFVEWRRDIGELHVMGSQKELIDARQYLKMLEPCRFSNRCTNSSCPYWHIMQCDLPQSIVQDVPEVIFQRIIAAVARQPGIEATCDLASVTICGSREKALAAIERLTPCRYNESCTNRQCAYLHIKLMPKFKSVMVGSLIGKGGCHVKDVESAHQVIIHIDDVSGAAESVWVAGSQDGVCKADKCLRGHMLKATQCIFGNTCTNRTCKFGHPNRHTVPQAKRTASLHSKGLIAFCGWGASCSNPFCKFEHPAGHKKAKG